MFTGIISEVGVVDQIDQLHNAIRLSIVAGTTVQGLEVGDSVAVNGVCLTAETLTDDAFTATAVHETLQRTSLGGLKVGNTVNLERPMAADGRFDGHIVQGHVDGVGTIAEIGLEGDSQRFRVEIPPELGRFLVEKGSICVDGTSLTVTSVSPQEEPLAWFDFVAIPHTLEATVLNERSVGDAVNLEVDVIAKYVQRLMETSP